MVKRKLTTIKLLLIFSVCIHTACTGTYLAQAKRVCRDIGKATSYLPKQAVSKVLSFFKKTKAPTPQQKFKLPAEQALGRRLTIPAKIFYTIFVAVGVYATIIAAIIVCLVPTLCAALGIEIYLHYRKACKNIVDPNKTEYQKLIASRGYLNLTKTVLENFNNINVHFAHRGEQKTPLHIIARDTGYLRTWYTRKPRLTLAKWMVEEKFANITAVDATGLTPRQTISAPYVAGAFAAGFNDIRQYLQDKEHQQQDLVDRVNTLKNHLDNNPTQEIINNLRISFQDIANIISDPETPGYAKMLVLPQLIQLWTDHNAVCRQNNICTHDDIISLYQFIEFNHSFLHEQAFRPAVAFAHRHKILDMKGNSLFETTIQHGTDERFSATISHTLATTPGLYRTDNVLRSWLAKQPTPTKKTGFLRNIFTKAISLFTRLQNNFIATPNNKKRNITQQYTQALDDAKQNKNKKRFRGLINPLIVNSHLRQTNLPDELAGHIMGYAGTDFGNRLLI